MCPSAELETRSDKDLALLLDTKFQPILKSQLFFMFGVAMSPKFVLFIVLQASNIWYFSRFNMMNKDFFYFIFENAYIVYPFKCRKLNNFHNVFATNTILCNSDTLLRALLIQFFQS